MTTQGGLVLPKPNKCQLWIDFDGTITKKDLLDELIFRYSVDDSWKELERQWRENLIGSKECLAGEFALIRVTQPQLEEVLESIQLDTGLFDLLNVCEQFSIPIAILSDGIDLFIKKILSTNGIFDMVLRSNTAFKKEDRFILSCPHHDHSCDVNAAHCKCASMKALGQSGKKNIYIGDGRSDLCPAKKADVIFAKNVLAECLHTENVDYIEYANLKHVARYLSIAWEKYTPAEQKVLTISGR